MADIDTNGARSEHNTSSTWSQIPGPSSKPDSARITIQLDNGKRFMVFVPQSSTMGDLQAAAIRRATKFGFSAPMEESELETIGKSSISMFSEDTLQDMVTLTEDYTFKLCVVDQSAYSKLSGATSILREKEKGEQDIGEQVVYIRWITVEDAFLNEQMTSIKVDHSPMLQSSPLSKLYETAVYKFLSGPGNAGGQVNLYLKECYLSAELDSSTFAELGLYGTKLYPLDVFVDIVPKSVAITLANLNDATDLSALWGVSTTMRGVCTFVACLEILLNELQAKPLGLENFWKTIFEVTHFPPLMLAVAQLSDSEWKDGQKAMSLCLVASMIQYLCFCDSVLEGSRQVFVWLKLIPASEGLLIDGIGKVVNSAHLVEKEEEGDEPTLALLPFRQIINVAGKNILVSLDREDARLAHFLANAQSEMCSQIQSSFLDFSGNWNKLVHHKKLSVSLLSDFEAFLQSANSAAAGKLKMIGPLQLGNLVATALPVLTLGTAGLVSVYDQEDYACGQKRFFMWNASQKKVILAHSNPGQELIQKLEPIIAGRKSNGTFGVDAWSDWIENAHFGKPEEAIVICMDTSYSMHERMPTAWTGSLDHNTAPSRLTEVKEFWKTFTTRISASKIPAHMGFLTFSNITAVTVRQALTGVHLDFEEKVEKIEPQTHTAIYNGIEKGREMLTNLHAQYPDCKLRIITLTDGEDNRSTIQPEMIARRLILQNVVLDSMVIGTNATRDLFKISRATGGYAFASQSQEAFFQICLLKTMIDISRRPDIIQVPATPWYSFLPKAADMPTLSDIPPCKPHPSQNDDFIALNMAERFWKPRLPSSRSYVVPPGPSVPTLIATSSAERVSNTGMGHLKAILLEFQAMAMNPHEDMDVYVSESNVGFWLVVMGGPKSSAYEGGTFLCYLDLAEFPAKPPKARFLTPVLHPNITKHGKICHPILDREYTPYTRVFEILQHIWGLFMSLEARDAVDPVSTLKHWTSPAEARKEVQDHVARFATLSRSDHAAKILRNEVPWHTNTSGEMKQFFGNKLT